MARKILYHVTFHANPSKNMLHIFQHDRFIACTHAIEDAEAVRAYHLDNGKHLRPDYAAIRQAIPHYHRKAFDRARNWFFPITLKSALSGLLEYGNACSLTLTDRRGKLLGTLYAVPYLAER